MTVSAGRADHVKAGGIDRVYEQTVRVVGGNAPLPPLLLGGTDQATQQNEPAPEIVRSTLSLVRSRSGATFDARQGPWDCSCDDADASGVPTKARPWSLPGRCAPRGRFQGSCSRRRLLQTDDTISRRAGDEPGCVNGGRLPKGETVHPRSVESRRCPTARRAARRPMPACAPGSARAGTSHGGSRSTCSLSAHSETGAAGAKMPCATTEAALDRGRDECWV